MAINTLGRERLIPAGGVADNTLSLGGGGKKFSLDLIAPQSRISAEKYTICTKRKLNAIEPKRVGFMMPMLDIPSSLTD